MSSKKLPAFFAAFCLVWTCSLFAMQIERNFPAGIKRGKMTVTEYAEIAIDGKIRLLTPGLIIYNEDNMKQNVGSLDVRNVPVFYKQNEYGELERIWILTAEEARLQLPKSGS